MYADSQWWTQVLDYTDIPDDPNEPGHAACMIPDRTGTHQLLLLEVGDPKSVKNRIHLDLRPAVGSRGEALDRLLALGTAQVADHCGKMGRAPAGSS